MRTLKNTFALAAFFVSAISLTAGAQQKPSKPQMKIPPPVIKPKTEVREEPPTVKELGEKVYISVEKAPVFPGGTEAFGKYLAKNVKYPAADRENNIKGKVYVSFVVERNGKLTDIVALRGPSATLKAEAVRVLTNSPAWKPGVQGGKPVRVQYTVPINFTLGGEQGALTAGAQQKTSKTQVKFPPPVVKPAPPVAKNPKDGDIYVAVENQPKFPGGMEGLGNYLSKNIKYPAADRENNIQGKVYVSFVIEPDGKLTKVEAVRGPSETMKAEAVRVMEGSPEWIPGEQSGKKVRTQYTVPINFTLGK